MCGEGAWEIVNCWDAGDERIFSYSDIKEKQNKGKVKRKSYTENVYMGGTKLIQTYEYENSEY